MVKFISPMADAQINLQGSQTLTTATDANGDYEFEGLTPSGDYTITPVAFGYTFNPINRQYQNLSATVTNANFTATPAPTRSIRVVGKDTVPGQTAEATIELVAQGDENSVAFSLQFDQGVLSNPQITLGADALNASLVVNDSQAAQGRIGAVMALPAGQTFTAGTKNILTVSFASAQTNLYAAPLDFGNVPVVKETANADADALPSVWTNGAVTFALGLGRRCNAASGGQRLGHGFRFHANRQIRRRNRQRRPTQRISTRRRCAANFQRQRRIDRFGLHASRTLRRRFGHAANRRRLDGTRDEG